ncbi:unnamed protein product, partial [marine sediment metagenome]
MFIERINKFWKYRTVKKEMIIIKTFQSPNYSQRKSKIDSIIIHHTGGSFPGCVHWLCNKEARVSAHYVINELGQIYELVPDHFRAWHAGRGAFDLNQDGIISESEKYFNDHSIGIELVAYPDDEDGKYHYSKSMKASLNSLVYAKLYEHKISYRNILGHKEIAP